MSRTCSNASIVPRTPGACPARAWGSPSSARPLRPRAVTRRRPTRPGAARSCACPLALRWFPALQRGRLAGRSLFRNDPGGVEKEPAELFNGAPKAQIPRELALALGAREAGEIARRSELVAAPQVACVGQPGR